MALKKVVASTSEKSGANKKLKPLAKSPLIMALTTITIIKINNIGINRRTILSIPLITPAEIIIIFNAINTECQNINLDGDEVTILNCSKEEISGVGLAALPEYLVSNSNNVIKVLPKVEGPITEAHFVYPQSLKNTARVQAFRNFLFSKIGDWK